MLFLFFAAMVVSHTPSPLSISEEKVEALMCDHSVKFDSLHERTKALKSSKISSIIVIVIKRSEFCAFGFFPLSSHHFIKEIHVKQVILYHSGKFTHKKTVQILTDISIQKHFLVCLNCVSIDKLFNCYVYYIELILLVKLFFQIFSNAPVAMMIQS